MFTTNWYTCWNVISQKTRLLYKCYDSNFGFPNRQSISALYAPLLFFEQVAYRHKLTNTSALFQITSLLQSDFKQPSITSGMFVNKTFSLTKDVPTTKAHATRIAQPVFILAISEGSRCLLFTNVQIIPVRCAAGSRFRWAMRENIVPVGLAPYCRWTGAVQLSTTAPLAASQPLQLLLPQRTT